VSRAVWDELLAAVRAMHVGHPDLAAFCDFPDDLTLQEVVPFDIKPSGLMQSDPALHTTRYRDVRDLFVAASPLACWRETYKDTDIGDDFMDRFGCYCLIGERGAFRSEKMLAYVVYMPAGLYYPWHHHPAEEMYMVLAGEAEFMRDGEANETLREGGASFHASNQPHAMETHEHPVMAYVCWRNRFDTLPVLTEG